MQQAVDLPMTVISEGTMQLRFELKSQATDVAVVVSLLFRGIPLRPKSRVSASRDEGTSSTTEPISSKGCRHQRYGELAPKFR